MIIEMVLAGFLFLFILVLNLVMGALGYLMEKDDYDPNADLKKIHNDPRKFKTGIGLALIEHGCVIALSILLFIAFGSHNLILGIVWTICRTGEGLLQYYNEPGYWGLLNIARKHSLADRAEKDSLSHLARTAFKAKETRFKFAMILWSIGTFTFSVALVIYGLAPQLIGWLGIVASVLVGFGTGIKLVRREIRVALVGALVAILFEVIIGGWLLLHGFA